MVGLADRAMIKNSSDGTTAADLAMTDVYRVGHGGTEFDVEILGDGDTRS